VTAEAATPRVRDPERTKAEIIEVATSEFARQGYAGARVDEIAAKTRTTKRMIYYYFGGKEGLFLAVLERAYRHIRSLEQQLDVDHLDPIEALRQLAELTFDHHESHQDFVRLVAIENIHYAEHLLRSGAREAFAAPALDILTRIMERGRAAGVP
jgi:AcrR family transcriptional regulator